MSSVDNDVMTLFVKEKNRKPADLQNRFKVITRTNEIWHKLLQKQTKGIKNIQKLYR